MEWSVDEERRILKKIDSTVLPILCFVFFFQYLDKQSLSYTAVFGLRTDLNLTSSQYSWCTSLFYFGQLVSEYLAVYLMSRLPLIRVVGISIIVWGGVCMCLAAPHNFSGFGAVRFLLGFTEAAIQPAAVTITSIWYRKEEHPRRVGIWVSMNALAQTIGAIMMYGIGKNSGLSVAPWRCMFLVCGGCTIAAGMLFLLVLPSGPDNAWFLTMRERAIIKQRMMVHREGGDQVTFSIPQLKEAMLDPKTWLVGSFGFLVTMSGPVIIFASLVISDIGYDKYETMLYSSPSGAVQFFFIWLGIAGCALMPNHRAVVIIALTIVPLVGSILLLVLDMSAGWGIIIASWLASSISCIMSIVLSLSASNVKGNTKRSVVNTVFFIGYCVGAIVGPQLWTEPPRYTKGLITSIVLWAVFMVFIAVYWAVCYFDNVSRDLKAQGDPQAHEHGVEDITDREDLLFRYMY
ncbi:putative allantoate permease [Aspergillus eucalypticola CBS 122712]|uniref:Allantoate permease n=1 Tax=Aspergillus eucalypticola (strain CBS 122712 / IBT 29274) TaxID=1448314 RepID=A0A317UMW6_ASPEC|nr:putative allantoate permease [Aspergillus eucalypticola CBS 122712]PWY63041.1 putative allantoate permease [Aspergillus eucalypticola CBS 122712]